MAGYGAGRSSRRFRQSDFENSFDTVQTRSYTARFHKLHAERERSWVDFGAVSYGMALRLSQVRFTSLTDGGQPIPLRRMTQLEPMAFIGFADPPLAPWLQLRITSSISGSTDERKHGSDDGRVRQIKEGRLFTSIGINLYPHRFKR